MLNISACTSYTASNPTVVRSVNIVIQVTCTNPNTVRTSLVTQPVSTHPRFSKFCSFLCSRLIIKYIRKTKLHFCRYQTVSWYVNSRTRRIWMHVFVLHAVCQQILKIIQVSKQEKYLHNSSGYSKFKRSTEKRKKILYIDNSKIGSLLGQINSDKSHAFFPHLISASVAHAFWNISWS